MLATTSNPPDLTPQKLRHTYATLLIARASTRSPESQMRLSTTSVTFDIYGHLNTDLDRLDNHHQRTLEHWNRGATLSDSTLRRG